MMAYLGKAIIYTHMTLHKDRQTYNTFREDREVSDRQSQLLLYDGRKKKEKFVTKVNDRSGWSIITERRKSRTENNIYKKTS